MTTKKDHIEMKLKYAQIQKTYKYAVWKYDSISYTSHYKRLIEN